MSLLIDLIISACLLWYFSSIPWFSRRGRVGILVALASGLLLSMTCLFVPVLLLNALLLAGVTAVCLLAAVSRPTFWKSSLVATGCAYLVASYFVVSELCERSNIREHYPLQSMSERLAREGRFAGPPELTFASGPLSEIETQTDMQMAKYDVVVRTDMLQKLHASFVRQFIDSPGFGMMRNLRNRAPSETAIKIFSGEREFPDTPETVDTVPAPDDSAIALRYEPLQTPEPLHKALWSVHRSALIDFVNVRGFGYVRDRDHVAGFRPHGIRDDPRGEVVKNLYSPLADGSRWRIGRLELVSLLKFAEPRVYTTPRLPRMGRLGDGRTRSVDGFEQTALDSLHAGEDLCTAKAADGLRVLGSIRAGKQCLACHAAERGELLGAFSYQLWRPGPSPAKDDARVEDGNIP